MVYITSIFIGSHIFWNNKSL